MSVVEVLSAVHSTIKGVEPENFLFVVAVLTNVLISKKKTE